MASRPGGYGYTAELEKKKAGKYDSKLEKEERAWISAILRKSLPSSQDFGAILKDGVILCQLMNTLKAGCVKKINEGTAPFKQMENISNFLTAAKAYGVADVNLFQTADLFDGTNVGQVIVCIDAVGRCAQKHGYKGPALGVKEAEGDPRNFSDKQMKKGDGIIGLQMGTNSGANQAGMSFGKLRDVQ